MNRTITIYTLSHPITNHVFYVGQTRNTLIERLCCHMASNDHKFHLNKHIKEIIRLTGKKPLIEPVDFGTRENKIKLEEYWIQQFAAWGFDLFNKQHLRKKKVS